VLGLRAQGLSWRCISERLGLGLGTVYRAVSGGLDKRER
jgi:transposase